MMRISEKTVELNLCAQINQNLNQRILWFGLTQKQEAKWGFDAVTQLNGRAILFQFKASNKTLRNGARRFVLEHNQLLRLQNTFQYLRQSVFYSFPLIGNTQELYNKNGDFYNNTWLLDVAKLPIPFPEPTTKTYPRRVRKNPIHYADVLAPQITIHSEPVNARLESLNQTMNEIIKSSEGINMLIYEFKDNVGKLLDVLKPFRQNFKMAVILPSNL